MLVAIKDYLPIIAAVCAGEGWLILAAYAKGLDVPLSALGVDASGYIAVAVAMLIGQGGVIYAFAARKHARTKPGRIAGVLFGCAVLASISAAVTGSWIAVAVAGAALLLWNPARLTPEPRSDTGALTFIGGGLILLTLPAVSMLFAGYSARTSGHTIVPLAFQPIVSQQAGHLDDEDACVLRLADHVYVERGTNGELHVVRFGDPPGTFTHADCTP